MTPSIIRHEDGGFKASPEGAVRIGRGARFFPLSLPKNSPCSITRMFGTNVKALTQCPTHKRGYS